MNKSNCEHPELKPKNGKCSDEQIKECHVKEESHPCDVKGTGKK